MKKHSSILLVLLALVLLDVRIAHADPIGILGVAGQYNVFLIGDPDGPRPNGGKLDLTNTDVEGRAAARGDVILNTFAIGSRVPDEQGIPSLVAGRSAILTNGSVGCQTGSSGCTDPQKGTIIYGTTTNQPAAGTVGYGALTQNANYIDFASAKSYVEGLSLSWKDLAPNGTDIDPTTNFNLTGTSTSLNIFNILASDIVSTGLSVAFNAPVGSTILVNILGDLATLNLMNMGFTYNGIPGENPPAPGEDYNHNAGFPYSSIIFNFPDETGTIHLESIALNGSLIAPFADLDTAQSSHVDGNIIALSLCCFGESHAIPFVGDVTVVPEPATLLLFAGGLFGIVARRRKK